MPNSALPVANGEKAETYGNKHVDEAKNANLQNDHDPNRFEAAETCRKKKRKHDGSENSIRDASDIHDGEVNQVEKCDTDAKKVKYGIWTEDTLEKIKWKELIKTSLKTSSDGAMKIKKLNKLVLKVMKESGMTDAVGQLGETLKQKIISSKRFIIDCKYVRLVAKNFLWRKD